jgi:hypothetical protein
MAFCQIRVLQLLLFEFDEMFEVPANRLCCVRCHASICLSCYERIAKRDSWRLTRRVSSVAGATLIHDQDSPFPIMASICRVALCAGGEQFKQHGVALALQFLNGTVPSLFLHSRDNRLLHLGAEFSDGPEIFPPGR